MNAWTGWALAALGLVVGWTQWGWQGVVLAVTLIIFWLLLQFSRSVRVMSQAAQAPVGHVDSAVMLHAKLKTGMRLLDILPLTRSLGEKVADDPETYVWRDTSGASVRVELVKGRCTRWELLRPVDDAAA
jgi:phosphatidylglycerophosphate synthase